VDAVPEGEILGLDGREEDSAIGFEIPLDVDTDEQPKMDELIALLGPRADCFVYRLWQKTAKFWPSGVIEVSPLALEGKLRWDGEPGVLHAGLVETGWIDKDGKTVHNWMKRAGHALEIYAAKKARMRKTYAVGLGILPAESGKTSEDPGDSGDSGGRGEDKGTVTVLKLMAERKIPGRWATKQSFAEAWVARFGEKKVVALLRKPEALGRMPIWIEDNLMDGKRVRETATQRGAKLKRKGKKK